MAARQLQGPLQFGRGERNVRALGVAELGGSPAGVQQRRHLRLPASSGGGATSGDGGATVRRRSPWPVASSSALARRASSAASGHPGQARRAFCSSAAASGSARSSRWVIAAVSASHGSARPRAGTHRGQRAPQRSEVPVQQQGRRRAVDERRDQRAVAGPLGVAQGVDRLPLHGPPAGRGGLQLPVGLRPRAARGRRRAGCAAAGACGSAREDAFDQGRLLA